MNKTVKNVAHYMTLPYTTVLRRDEDDDVIARVEELPGCVAHGSDEAEAIGNLREMQKLWLEDCVETGQVVPVPAPESCRSAISLVRPRHRAFTGSAGKTESAGGRGDCSPLRS